MKEWFKFMKDDEEIDIALEDSDIAKVESLIDILSEDGYEFIEGDEEC